MKKQFLILMTICSLLNQSIIIFASSEGMSWPGNNSNSRTIIITQETNIASSCSTSKQNHVASATSTTSNSISAQSSSSESSYKAIQANVAYMNSILHKKQQSQPLHSYKSNTQAIKEWTGWEIAKAIKNAQEKNLDSFSYLLEIRVGQYASYYTVQEFVPGVIASKERLADMIYAKKKFYNELQKEAKLYAHTKEYLQELKNRAMIVEQEITDLQSKIITIDIAIEKTKVKKLTDKIKEDKIAACHQVYADIFMCIDEEQRCLELIRLYDCHNEIEEFKNDDFNSSVCFNKNFNDRLSYSQSTAQAYHNAWQGGVSTGTINVYLGDVIYDGRLCQQYAFIDANGQYTDTYFIPYDTKEGQVNGYFVHSWDQISTSDKNHKFNSLNSIDFQNFAYSHSAFVDKHRAHAILSKITNFTVEHARVDMLPTENFSTERKAQMHRDIAADEYAYNFAQKYLNSAQNTLQSLIKSNKKSNKSSNVNYNLETVNYALTILEVEKIKPGYNNKAVLKMAQKIVDQHTKEIQKAIQIARDKKAFEDTQAQIIADQLAEQQKKDTGIKAAHNKKASEYAQAQLIAGKLVEQQRKNILIKSSKQQIQAVNKDQLDRMQKNYQQFLDSENYQKSSLQEQTDNPFAARLEKRAQALVESQEQIRTHTLVKKDFTMSSHARAYLMANNMNYAAFDSIVATNIQHCLTQENIDIIESMTQLAERSGYNAETKDFINHTCNLAITAQQLNQRSQIEAAALLTDLNHINAYFAQIPDGENLFLDIAIGTAQGFSRFVCKWSHFLRNLYEDPSQSIAKMGADLRAMGSALSDVSSALYNFTPLAKDIDTTLDYMGYHPEQIHNTDGTTPPATYTDQRALKKQQTIEHIIKTTNDFVEYVKKSSVRNFSSDTSELVSNMVFDTYLTNKAFESLSYVTGKVSESLLVASNDMSSLLPPELMDEVVTYMQNSAGEIVAVSEKTCIDLGKAAQLQAIVNKTEYFQQSTDRAKNIINSTAQFQGPAQEEVIAFQKSIQSHINKQNVLDPERLKTIDNIDQIEEYRKYTNNFHPDGLAKLNPDEIMHLNVCDWLEPQARIINTQLKKSGGITLKCFETGFEAVFEEYDLFHVILGDIRPGSIRDHTKGSHLLIPELQAEMFHIGEFKHIHNGYFDMFIKRGSNKKFKTYFPKGTSVQKTVEILQDAIKNPKKIRSIGKNGQTLFEITNQSDDIFEISVVNKKARFYPANPDSINK